MKKNSYLFILLILFCQIIIAQKKKEPIKKTYQKIDKYKELNNLKSVNLDSLDFLIYKGDTLIRYEHKIDPTKILVDFDYRDSTFLNYYIPVAFRLSTKTKDSLKTTMKYWRNDIKIFFSDNISRRLKKEFLKFTSNIDENLDSLSISMVKKIEQSNYSVYTSLDYNYESNLMNSKKSSYQVYWNKDNKIYKGAIKLDSKKLFNDQQKLYELKKLFVQSLGYFKFDSRLDCKHFFSYCYSPEKSLTDLDLEILKYHYSYGICKGITLKSFLHFHKEANKIKAKGGKISISHLVKDLKKEG